ncbi:MAG: NAD-dependent deacylase [Planctomycetes bacterium]|nr:NAD-dependent deacylase [Planctomycetota bacterium]
MAILPHSKRGHGVVHLRSLDIASSLGVHRSCAAARHILPTVDSVCTANAVLRELGDNRPPIVILTGAGISAESGLMTFRGNGGLWEGHRVEDVATPEAFMRNPELVHRFYNERRSRLQAADVEPNAAHMALAMLESRWPTSVTVITQNVDNLHERGGSANVIHMHGELMKIRHADTGEVRHRQVDCDATTLDGRWRPHIVWFGEAILESETTSSALATAGLFLCIGTVGQVYPAAGFVHEVRGSSAEFNLEPTSITAFFDYSAHGPAGETLPRFVDVFLDF